MGSIKNVVSEPIEGHEDYHMMVSSGPGPGRRRRTPSCLFLLRVRPGPGPRAACPPAPPGARCLACPSFALVCF